MIHSIGSTRAVVIVVMILSGSILAQEIVRVPPGRKVIEWGWDEPGPAFIREHAASMDVAGFDGTIFHADTPAGNFTWECWGAKRFTYEDFAGSVADLQAAHAVLKRLTDNFLRFNVCPGNVDWFDDDAFAVVTNNAAVAAKVAATGGCKGLMFDIEVYNEPLFSYDDLPHGGRSFAEYEAKVTQRGAELMRAFNRDFPDLTLLLTYGYGITGVGGDRTSARYGLLKNLFDGMFAAASPGTVIVDAFEGAYSFRAHSQFVTARKAVLDDMRAYVADPAAYDRHIQVAFGIWMDNRYGAKGWHTEDFEQNFFLPDEFEYSVFCGLTTTDTYVWVYTEHLLWWTDERVPAVYRQALQNVRNPRAIDDAAYANRQVKGMPKGKGPFAEMQAGYSDEETFAGLEQEYDFLPDLPKTWRFRKDPETVGESQQWFSVDVADEDDWQDLEIGRFWDEQDVTHVGEAWYRVSWMVPELPAEAEVFLWFGAVDEQAVVWVNGRKAGEYIEPPDIGWDKRFPIDVSGMIMPGATNTVAVKVINTTLAGGMWKSVRLAVKR